MTSTAVETEVEKIEEHDSVVLTEDIPAHELDSGDQGVVVHIYSEGLGYEVEFFDWDETTRCVLTLTASQVRPAPKGVTDEF